MAPVHLLDQIMQLPERDRLGLVEDVIAASIDARTAATPVTDGDEVAQLEALLAAADRDLAAGRTRPIEELLHELRAMV